MSWNGYKVISVVLFGLVGALTANAGKSLHLKKGVLGSQQLQTMNIQSAANFSSQKNQHYIVQFNQKVTEALKESLKQQDVEIIRYIPDDALLLKVNSGNASKILKASNVIVAMAYDSYFKISPEVTPASIFNANQSVSLVLSVMPNTSREHLMAELETIGSLKIQEDGNQILRVEIENYDLTALAQLSSIEWVEPYSEMKLLHMDLYSDAGPLANDGIKGDYTDLTGYENGTKIMNFPEAWGRGYTGKGQKVAMADTGLANGDLSTIHADFGNQVSEGQVYGLFSQSWSDPMGHGTHVAGSVLSKGEASDGNFIGGAFEAQMVAQGMWSPVLNNLTVPAEVSTLFEKGLESGATIHTNSWGNPTSLGKYDKNAMQVDKFMWEHPEMLIVFAAGNSGRDDNKDGHIDNGSVSSPGTAKNSLTVGASENLLDKGGIQAELGKLLGGKAWGVEPLASDTLSNNINGMAAFSSIGPTADGRIKPDVVAPGTNIISNCSQEKGASPLWGKYNDDYCYSGGTSMSTPLVAGAAAVISQYLKEEHELAQPMAATIKAVLMNSAFDMYPGQYGTGEGQELATKAPNVNEGYGRVDVEKATRGSGEFFALVKEHDGIATDEIYEIEIDKRELSVACNADGESIAHLVSCVSVGCGTAKMAQSEQDDFCLARKLKVTLVYNDAPAALLASKTLVNNIDLKVIVGDQEWNSASEINNSEQVTIESLPSDLEKVKVIVTGVNVPEGKDGKLPFSLVVSKDL